MRHGNRRGPSRRSNLWLVSLIAVGVLSLAVVPHHASASTQVVSRDLVNCASDVAPGATVHRRIQPAVNEAITRGEDETILICPGTHFGPVTINDEDADIDFIGVGDKSDVIIRAHSGSPGPIFRVLEAEHIGFMNLTVDGMSRLVPSGLGGVVEGIRLRRTDATIDNVMVQNIDSPDGNAQGICVHIQGDGSSQEVEVTDSIFSNCTRVAVLANGEGIEADVQDNIIIGPLGPHTFAPNGVQFSRGAEGEIRDNIIDSVESLTPTVGAGSGIILYCAGDTHVEDNIVTNTDLGISVTDTEDATVISNDMLGNATSILLQTIGDFFGTSDCPGGASAPADNGISFNNLLESINVGIDVNSLDLGTGVPEDNDVESNIIEAQNFFGILVRQGEDNSFEENLIIGAIVDQTTGGGTSGTANEYDDNGCTLGSDPAGLCDTGFSPILATRGLSKNASASTAASPF